MLTGRERFDTVTTQKTIVFLLLLINAAQLCVCKNKTCLCLPSMRLSSLSICSSVATHVSCFGKARPSELADILSVCCSLQCFYRCLTFRLGVVEKATAPTRGYRAKHVSQFIIRDAAVLREMQLVLRFQRPVFPGRGRLRRLCHVRACRRCRRAAVLTLSRTQTHLARSSRRSR